MGIGGRALVTNAYEPADGRLASSALSNGALVSHSYDYLGRLSTRITPADETAFSYLGNLDGSTTIFLEGTTNSAGEETT